MHSTLIAVAFLIILLSPCAAAFSSDLFPIRVRIQLPARRKSRRTLQPELAPTLKDFVISTEGEAAVERSGSVATVATPRQQTLFPSRAA